MSTIEASPHKRMKVSVSLTVKQVEMIDAVAHGLALSRSAVISLAIRNFLLRQEKENPE